jgi:hypothetical protein
MPLYSSKKEGGTPEQRQDSNKKDGGTPELTRQQQESSLKPKLQHMLD